MVAALGRDGEEAATMLGAGFAAIFLYPMLAGIDWALLSGHIPGLTETVPLRIETL